MSTALEYALLSLDSYNRGYDPGVIGLSDQPGTVVGRWSTIDVDLPPDSQAASFYAAAYQDASGNIVISYRGTDGFGDVTAWAQGGGFETAQSKLAIQFHDQVRQAHPGTTITLTGHSLGAVDRSDARSGERAPDRVKPSHRH